MKKLNEYRHHYQTGTLNRPLIDRKRLEADLAVERSGREDGLREIPATDATTFSVKENEIIGKINDELKTLRDDCNAEMQTYQARLQESYNFQSLLDKMQQIADAIKSKVEQRSNIWRDRMSEHSKGLVDADGALKAFQRQHHREGPPHAHRSHVLTVGIVAALFLIEAAINAVFFAAGSEFGLLGGIVSAFVLGLFNTVLAFVFGIGGRYINRIEWYLKIWGGIIIIVYLCVTLFVNFSVGHYRDLATNLQLEDPSTTFMSQFGLHVITFAGLQSFGSLLMIGVGLVFSLLCFLDGFFLFADTYPGYSKIYQRRETEADDFILCKDEAYMEIENLAQEDKQKINDLVSQIEKGKIYYQQILISRKNWIDSFTEHQDYLETVANDLLTVYRQANGQTRKSPPPPYFSQRWQLRRIPIPEDLHAMMSETELSDFIKQAAQMARQYSEQIKDAQEEAFREFKRIEDITPL